MCMLDQVFRKKYQYPQYQICIIRSIRNSIFIFYLFCIVDVDILRKLMHLIFWNRWSITCLPVIFVSLLATRPFIHMRLKYTFILRGI
uniref:Uncharacterized protein n=1 Tax=Aegilops tauschii subsp. strangulata TaxID=200361 RepID=A0A453ARQ2_AEGTS